MVALAPPLVEVVLDPPITNITKPSNNPSNSSIGNPILQPKVDYNGLENRTKIAKKECNMYDGRWVYKEEEQAAYNVLTCPLLRTQVKCQDNGRSDLDYVKWRWEATDCDIHIPLFNGKDMLERLRNKRVIIVGDSLNHNMWESLACLIYTSIPSSRMVLNIKKGPYTLLAKDYNFKVEFHMSPFLTELNLKHKSGRKVLILDKISTSSKRWKGADVMVFNSGHWWTHNNQMKAWDLYQYKGKLIEDMPRDLAFKRAMTTWMSWVKRNVDTKRTNVFFRSFSPSHNHRKSNQWCYNVTKPMMDESYVMGWWPKNLVNVVESLMKEMNKLNVKYLNITKISEYRSDAHPSIFTMDLKSFDKKEYDNLSRKADCNHWCLPGLPDTWNRLMYASLFHNMVS